MTQALKATLEKVLWGYWRYGQYFHDKLWKIKWKKEKSGNTEFLRCQ